MRWSSPLVVLLLLSLASAGCLEGDGKEPTQDVSQTTSASRSSTSSPTNGTAPAANATQVNVTATLTASHANGTAPLNVTFTVDGSGPGNLTWVLEWNSTAIANGTQLPANHTQTFTEAGNHTVVLTVSAGNRTATANVTIVVEPGTPATREDLYVIFNADGTCDAKGERTVGVVHVHDRQASPPEPGLVDGGGTWVYEESNGKAGLQVGGSAEDAPYQACKDPDTLVF